MTKRKVIELPKDVAPMMKEIGLKVVEYRKQQHPNYRKFAELNKISVMTLWRVQNGEDIKLSSFLQILMKMRVSPQDFFNGFKW
jgi:hypothetical protein